MLPADEPVTAADYPESRITRGLTPAQKNTVQTDELSLADILQKYAPEGFRIEKNTQLTLGFLC